MAEAEHSRTAIAQRLKLAREQAGLSQGQVAKMMAMHRPSISEIEAGRRKVSAEELSQFAMMYDISISWLANAESEVQDSAVELAARELAKIKREDLDKVLQLLRTLRKRGSD